MSKDLESDLKEWVLEFVLRTVGQASVGATHVVGRSAM